MLINIAVTAKDNYLAYTLKKYNIFLVAYATIRQARKKLVVSLRLKTQG